MFLFTIFSNGEYYVALPDGRTPKVTYVADESGYVPTVEYIGEPVYAAGPVSYSAPAPKYQA